MQKDPPKASEVGLAALKDLKENLNLVKGIVTPVFPVMVVIAVLDTYLQTIFIDEYGQKTAAYKTFSVMGIFITSWIAVHYVMRWHMYTLLGNVDYKGTWMSPDRKYKLFFFKTLVLQFVAVAAIILPALIAMIVPVLGLLIMLPSWFIGIYIVCRLSFLLPATVLGHTPNLQEIWDFAQGMVLKTILAPILATYKYILLLILYLFVSGFILEAVGLIKINMDGSVATGTIFVTFLFYGIPMLIVGILLGLVYVGVLSRYYQWGLENRTDAYGDFK